MGTDLTVFNRLRPMSIGFNSLFDQFESMLQSDFMSGSNYPPYNIYRTDDNHYTVELAVAGFRKDQVSVSVQDNQLVIASRVPNDQEIADDSLEEYDSEMHGLAATLEMDDGVKCSHEPVLIHRGISQRAFRRTFRLAEGVEVVDAAMSDGMLSINLERIVPEEDRPRLIVIK